MDSVGISAVATSTLATIIFGTVIVKTIEKITNPKYKSIYKIIKCNENDQENNNKRKKPIRIYLDGCWDLMHSGHYNAIRQAKALGDILVAGIHSDEEITINKREPVMNNQQRIAAVKACKWVDQVVFDVPYAPTPKLIEDLNCDYVAHGDDTTCDPDSIYFKVADKFKMFRRTPGVSTTHLIQRLLDAAKYNLTPKNKKKNFVGMTSTSSWSSFLPSTSRIAAFSNNKMPNKKDKVIYIDGAFDLFHVGHIAALKKAKQLGTFLYVGIYDDDTIKQRKNKFHPIMGLQERILNVLSCKYVDDVIVGAPWILTKEVLKTLNISKVVVTKNTVFAADELDRYNVAKKLGIYVELSTNINYTTDMLMDTIVTHQNKFESQNKSRVEKAKKYTKERAFIPESPNKKK